VYRSWSVRHGKELNTGKDSGLGNNAIRGFWTDAGKPGILSLNSVEIDGSAGTLREVPQHGQFQWLEWFQGWLTGTGQFRNLIYNTDRCRPSLTDCYGRYPHS